MIEPIVTTIIGLVGGFGLSALLLYIQLRVLSPRITFSEKVRKETDPSGAVVYRVVVRNSHRRRGVIDVTFHASVRYPLRAVHPSARASSMISFEVPTRNTRIFRLSPGKTQLIDVDFEDALAGKNAQSLIERLYPIRNQRDNLNLEDVLRRSEGAHFMVRILCYDEWSGSRRYYESWRYKDTDVEPA